MTEVKFNATYVGGKRQTSRIVLGTFTDNGRLMVRWVTTRNWVPQWTRAESFAKWATHVSDVIDRRGEYFDQFWQQGALLTTRQTQRWTEQQRAEGHALEKTLVFAHFDARDEGRSRVLLFACETAEEATEMVASHNRFLVKVARNPAMREYLRIGPVEIIRHRSFQRA